MDINKNNISISKTGENFQASWNNDSEFSCSYFNKIFCSTIRRNMSYYQLENILFVGDFTFKNILNLPLKSPNLKSFNEISLNKKNFGLIAKKIDNFYSFTTTLQLLYFDLEHEISYEDKFFNNINIKAKAFSGGILLRNQNLLIQYKNFVINLTEKNFLYILEDIDFRFEGSLNDRLDIGILAKNQLAHNFIFTMRFLSNLKNLSDIKCGFDLQINL